eukprot:scaffold171651_cov63-Attheya_sp.AAC.4
MGWCVRYQGDTGDDYTASNVYTDSATTDNISLTFTTGSTQIYQTASDHAAIQLKLKFATRMTGKKTRFNTRNRGEEKKKKVKLNWTRLRNKKTKMEYNMAIKRIIGETERDPENQLQYGEFIETAMQAAEENIAGNGRISEDWFKTSEIELNQGIGLRNHWHNVWVTTSVPKARERYKEVRSNLKREIKKAKVKWYEDRVEEI